MLYLNHVWQPRFALLVMLSVSYVPNKLYLAERFVQKNGGSKYCTVTSLTGNSVMDIFRQVSQNFQNIAVFKAIFKKKFCQ